MNEQELIQKIKKIENTMDEIDERTRKIRRTQIIRFVIAIVLFFLPLVAIIFSIPFLLEYLQLYQNVIP